MSELSNTVSSVGNYNNIPTSLTSNTSVVNIIDGLTLTKNANKQNWSDGFLTYTITLDNQTDTTYESPIITDVIDTSLVEFVNDSVSINGVSAISLEYSYNDANHTLTVNLEKVDPTSKSIVTLNVKKNITTFSF